MLNQAQNLPMKNFQGRPLVFYQRSHCCSLKRLPDQVPCLQKTVVERVVKADQKASLPQPPASGRGAKARAAKAAAAAAAAAAAVAPSTAPSGMPPADSGGVAAAASGSPAAGPPAAALGPASASAPPPKAWRAPAGGGRGERPAAGPQNRSAGVITGPGLPPIPMVTWKALQEDRGNENETIEEAVVSVMDAIIRGVVKTAPKGKRKPREGGGGGDEGAGRSSADGGSVVGGAEGYEEGRGKRVKFAARGSKAWGSSGGGDSAEGGNWRSEWEPWPTNEKQKRRPRQRPSDLEPAHR